MILKQYIGEFGKDCSKVLQPKRLLILHLAVLSASGCFGTIGVYGSPTPASNQAGNPAEYDQAVKDYKARKYAAALVNLKKLHETNKCSDMSHYFMALCYQCMNQMSAAYSEYRNVAKSKDPSLKVMADRALLCIDRWNRHRLYQGNGNDFARYSSPNTRLASSSGPRLEKPISEINIQMPPPSGGC